VVYPSAVPPMRGCPEMVRCGVVEEVSQPCLFCLVDSLSEVFDCVGAGLALGGSNTCKGSLTVNVPPTEAPEVQRLTAFKVCAQHCIDVHV